MKKQYIKPTATVMVIQSSAILVNSFGVASEDKFQVEDDASVLSNKAVWGDMEW